MCVCLAITSAITTATCQDTWKNVTAMLIKIQVWKRDDLDSMYQTHVTEREERQVQSEKIIADFNLKTLFNHVYLIKKINRLAINQLPRRIKRNRPLVQSNNFGRMCAVWTLAHTQENKSQLVFGCWTQVDEKQMNGRHSDKPPLSQDKPRNELEECWSLIGRTGVELLMKRLRSFRATEKR